MEQLFTDFKTTDAATWKARLEKDLKGLTFEQLSVTDRNGIVIQPFYTSEDTTNPQAPERTEADWSICEKINAQDEKTANIQALTALNAGASGLCFILEQSADPAVLLDGIELPYIYTCFNVQNNDASFAAKLIQYLANKGWDIHSMDCFISHDYIANNLLTGNTSDANDEETFLSVFGQYTNHFCVDGTLFLNAGANSVYELACTLAQVNEYLHLLTEHSKAGALKKVQVSLATDTSFFEQIAKLRAFRKLLALLFEQYQVEPVVHLHLQTANTYRSPFDSYSNLLRDSIAGMAAVLGGCDSLYIRPFNETLEEPTDFSRRMSRNQQLIFKEESYLNKVADAAAGSYYLETLTEHIAEKAWEQFKSIEAEGGLRASFNKGKIKETITTQAQQLIQEYKDGRRVLIGVNKFVNAGDQPVAKPDANASGNGLHQLLLANEIL